MMKLSNLSDSDIFILAIAAMVLSFIFGLLTDMVMRDKGFGPLRNACVILAGGALGVALRDAYYPVPAQSVFMASLLAAVAMSTVALIAGSVVKLFVDG